MNIFKAALDTRHQNGVIGTVTQFDNAILELQVVTDGVIEQAWDSPQFELLAMKRDANPVREVDQDRFTILSKEDHKVQIELKEQFLTCRGTVKMQLVVKDGGRLSTTLFYLSIGRSLDHEIAESLTDIQVLDDLDQVVESLGVLEVTASANESKRQENEKLREVAEVNRQEEFDQSQLQRDTEFNNKMEEYQEYVSGLEGIQGKPGETPQIQVNETHIQLKYPSQQEWTDLVALESLKGPEGPIGPPGIQGKTGEPGKDGANGENGQDGMTPNFTIGTVTTLEPGQEATVTIRGTKENPILDIAIPRGPNGKDGEGGVSATDKVDYMGEQHDTLKETNDANVEYLLREINTAHYEGSNITATDTYQKQVKSAILKGNTVVNLVNFETNLFKTTGTIVATQGNKITFTTSTTGKFNLGCKLPVLKPNTKYLLKINAKSNLPTGVSFYLLNATSNSYIISNTTISDTTYLFTTNDVVDNIQLSFYRGVSVGGDSIVGEAVVCEYQDGMENWDIPYFTGMQSVRMPVLTTIGKNLNPTSIEAFGLYDSTGMNNNDSTQCRTDDFISVIPNQVLTVSSDQQINRVFGYDKDGNYLGLGNGGIIINYGFANKKEHTFTVPNNCYNIKITSFVNTNTYFQIEEGTQATAYEPYKSNILSTPEDIELGSVGDVKDELDLVTGELAQRTDIRAYQEGDESNSEVLTDMTNTRYKLAKEVVKTVDLNGQKVYSYDGTTHYSCSAAEGALIPTLSIDVPTNLSALVSRQRTTIENQKEQIITLEEENEQLIAQNEVQDIDISLNQDAINFMLFAPTAMSLAEHTKGVNTMAAYLANQILKGRLDYTLVVGRYGEFKEDIDTILISEGKQDLIK